MKFTSEIDYKNVQQELNGKLKLLSKILFYVGLAGLLAYIVVSTIWDYPWLDYLLWGFAFVFAFGLVFWITTNKVNKSNCPILTNSYEFCEEYFSITTYKRGDQIGFSKIFYKDIKKIKSTTSYLFLFVNMAVAYPIPKKELTLEQLAQINTYITNAKPKHK